MLLSRRIFLGLAGATLVAPALAKEKILRAYNIEMLHQSLNETDFRGDGWVFGLPPGISTAQWPLDPNNGYPLNHGFTIRLPEDYRVHGAEIVGLSFFAVAFDHNDGIPLTAPAVRAFFDETDPKRPGDPSLLPFWDARHSEHPRLFRMRDILDLEYAVILLTESEFTGPYAQPPRLEGNPHLAEVPKPAWLDRGSAAAFWDASYSPGSVPPHEYFIYKQLGGIPEPRLEFNRAIRITPRLADPNAGIAPDESGKNGYQREHYWEGGVVKTENYRLQKWVKSHLPNHVGGTMRPIQGFPDFSPYHIGFEEYFGGYNFGTGNAQLDFKDMKFDWAQ